MKCGAGEREKNKVGRQGRCLKKCAQGKRINPIRRTKVTGLNTNLERTVCIGRCHGKTYPRLGKEKNPVDRRLKAEKHRSLKEKANDIKR